MAKVNITAMENQLYPIRVLASILEMAWLKSLVASGLIALHFLFDTVNSKAMIAVIVLILIDFVTAIHAGIRTGEKIESHKVFRTAVKVATYSLLVAAARVSEYALPMPFLDDTVIAFLASTELVSVMENTAKAGFVVPKALIEKLKEFDKTK